MSKIQLEIIIPQQDLAKGFSGGDIIRGKLNLLAQQTVQCKNVTLSLGWETRGSGNNVKSPRPKTQTLYEGTLTEGEQKTLDFEIEVPKYGPFTYEGKKLSVLYFLTARANIPMALDPETKLEILVYPSEEEGLIYIAGDGGVRPFDLHFDIGSLGPVWGVVLTLFVSGLATIPFGILIMSLASPARVVPFISISFLCVVAVVGSTLFRNVLAQYKVEKPIFEIPKNVFSPGETIPFGISVIAKRMTTLNSVKVTFRAEEVTISGSGKNQTTHRHEVFRKEQTFSENTHLQEGEEKKILHKIEIPEKTPYYFEYANHKVVSELVVHFDIAGSPDYQIKKTIFILPQGYKAGKTPVKNFQEIFENRYDPEKIAALKEFQKQAEDSENS